MRCSPPLCESQILEPDEPAFQRTCVLSAPPQRTLEACTASYSGWVFEALRFVSVDVENVGVHTPAGEEEPRLKPEKGKARATVTVELDVTPEMTNLSGNMHGGCTATLLDMCVLV